LTYSSIPPLLKLAFQFSEVISLCLQHFLQ
jgi:hypothetical protein